MNCKPGELAYTVSRSKSGFARHNSGRLVDVIRFIGTYTYSDGVTERDVWLVKSLGGKFIDSFGREHGPELRIADRNLRPIRDPGEDARDETLEWLPVPTHTTEAAFRCAKPAQSYAQTRCYPPKTRQ